MVAPTPHTVAVRRFQAGATDAHGNPVDSWAAAGPDVPVHFVAPADSVEPYREHRDLLRTDLAVGAPKTDALPGALDLVVWDGEEYRVEGDVADYTFGPWVHPHAGVTFLIRKVEG